MERTASMTQDELIAAQALEIAELKANVAAYEADRKAIRSELYCIGGPLNDNKLGYSRAQLGPFFRISERTEFSAGAEHE